MRREYKWVDHLPAMITHSSQPPSQLPNCEPTHSTQFRHISPIYPVKLPISTYTLFHLPTCHLGSSTYPLKRVFLTFLPSPVLSSPHRRATAPVHDQGMSQRSAHVTIRSSGHPVIPSFPHPVHPFDACRQVPLHVCVCMCARRGRYRDPRP